MSEDATRRVKRRLAAVLFAGYGNLVPGDEAGGLAGLTILQCEIIEPEVLKFSGHIIRWSGEGVFIEFESVVEAVRCAATLREAVSRFNEALAEPGSVYVSEIVRDRVAGRVDFDFVDLGLKELKNISRPIRVYRMGGAVSEQSAAYDEARAVEAASPAGVDDRRAIAVLPFANFNDDPEQEFFADGITEDIISMLAGWHAFPVIARNSTFIYKGQTVDIKKVGQELGVRYVVEGSVRKSGRRIRVTTQLIRADTGHHIMAERYDRALTDLFELQDELVTTIAGAIEPELLKFERNRIAERPPRSEDAYELYQRGMWHHYRHNKEDNIEAQRLFRAALAIDPDYPQALATLSMAVCNAGFLGWADNAERNYDEAFELARRAVTLNARYPTAHFALGGACMHTHRSNRAIAEFEEAIKLNPSFAAAHAVLGHSLTYAGRPEDTVPLVEKAIRLSPNDPRLFIWLPAMACAHYQLHRYDQAIEAGRRSWTLNRSWPVGLRYVVAGLAQLGRLEEARAALADLRRLDTDLGSVERLLRLLFRDAAAVDHIVDGLRKAGFE